MTKVSGAFKSAKQVVLSTPPLLGGLTTLLVLLFVVYFGLLTSIQPVSARKMKGVTG